jgi:hypothetical protein
MGHFGSFDLRRAASDGREQPNLFAWVALGRNLRATGDPAQISLLYSHHMLDAFQNRPTMGGRFRAGLRRGDVSGGSEEIPAAGFEGRDETHQEQCIPNRAGLLAVRPRKKMYTGNSHG